MLRPSPLFFFFFNDTATTEIYTLSLHDALPISAEGGGAQQLRRRHGQAVAETVLQGSSVGERPLAAQEGLRQGGAGGRLSSRGAPGAQAGRAARHRGVRAVRGPRVPGGDDRPGRRCVPDGGAGAELGGDDPRRIHTLAPQGRHQDSGPLGDVLKMEEHGHQHAHLPHRTGHSWLDISLAVSAFFVSLSSLWLTLHNARTMERLVAANSYPNVDISVGNQFDFQRSEEHTSELQSQSNLVCRLLLEKKKKPS